MKALKFTVYTASALIFGICLYLFLLGNGVFEFLTPRLPDQPPPTFRNDPFSWYFLAKGMFCSLSLYLSVTLIETINGLKAALVQNVGQTASGRQTATGNVAQNVSPAQTAAVHPAATMPPRTMVVPAEPEKNWYQSRQGVGH